MCVHISAGECALLHGVDIYIYMHSFDSWEVEGLSVEEEKLQGAIVTRGSDSVASARSNLV